MSNINVNNITPQSGDKVSISGSLHASGDITANGNITLGNSSSDSVYFGAEVSSSIIPDATNTYDLGSPSKVWREIYVSSESLNFVDGAGSSSKFTKENVDDLKSGKSSATIGGFATSTRTKAIFQDDDTSTYKKMTVPGRVSQFISGAMVKDYNKSGSNSYTTYDNIDSISWMNFSSMSMDVNAGGFFGVGVSGSTYASNLAQFYIDFVQSGSTTFEGGNVDVEVEDSGSSFTISGSEGTTLNVSGGNVVITSEFTQSGTSTFDDGTTTINSNPSSSLSGSDALVVTDPSGSGTAVIDTVLTGWDNDIPITSSITLTNVAHGLGRQVMVRSGSGVGNLGLSPQNPYYGLPTWAESYKVAKPGPAGTIELTLPAATIGLSFNIVNQQFPAYPWGDYYHPNVKVSPSGSNKFIYGAGGSTGVAGKAIILPSGSAWQGDNVVVSCVSQSHWMIQQIGGTWTDEA